MPLDFPSSPAVNDKYPSPAQVGVPVYTWDGEKWTTKGGAIGSTGGADDLPLMDGSPAAPGVSVQWAREDHQHPTDTSLLPKTGGTITGGLTVNSVITGMQAIQASGAVVSLIGQVRSSSNANNVDAVYYFDINSVYKGACYYDTASQSTRLFHATGKSAYVTSDDWFATNCSNAGKPGGGSWSAISDARIKNVLGNYDNGLAAIDKLQPVRYTYKGNDTRSAPSNVISSPNAEVGKGTPVVPYKNSDHYSAAVDGTQYVGLVAQPTESVMPELVNHASGFIDGNAVSDLRTLDPGPLIFALVNAVKELKARVEQLEAT